MTTAVRDLTRDQDAGRARPVPRAVPLGRMVRHEWRLLVADRLAWWVIGLGVVLMLGATWQGRARVAAESAAIQSVQAEAAVRRDSLRAMADRVATDPVPPASSFAPDPRLPFAVGNALAAPWATLPPGALLGLAAGQQDLVRPYVKITLGARQSVVQLEQLDNPLNLLDGGLDLAFVVLHLVPLVIIALGYALLTGEREAGTLGLLLSQPITVGRLLTAKLVVRAGLVLGLVLVASWMAAALTGGWQAPGGLSAMALWSLAVVGWVGFWFAACVLANTRPGATSAANAVGLVALWLVLVVVAPAVVSAVAQWRHPTPSRVALIGEVRDAGNAANAKGTELLKQFYGDHPELAPAGTVDLQDFAARRLVVQEAVDRTVNPVLDRFTAQVAAQQALVQRWQWLSPAIALHAALLEAAGTGASRYRRFETAVVDFHARWLGYFAERIYAKRSLAPRDLARLPTWQWEEPSAAAVARTTMPSVGLLWLVAAMAVGLAWRGARRVRVLG